MTRFLIYLFVIIIIVAGCVHQQVDDELSAGNVETSLTIDAIGDVLLLDDDLPSGYAGGQVEDRTASYQEREAGADLVAYMPIEAEAMQAGFVMVTVYRTENEAELGYGEESTAFINAAEGPRLEDNFGTIAESYFGPRSCDCYQNIFETVFQRCISVVHIRLTPPHLYDESVGQNYAERLDERITTLACSGN